MPCIAHREESALWAAEFRREFNIPVGSKPQKGSTEEQRKNIMGKLKTNTEEQSGLVSVFYLFCFK